MAHFAKLDKNNKVISVHVVSNEVATDEQKGIDHLKSVHGQDTKWVQTSYNTYGGKHLLGGTPFRKNFAQIGGSYHLGLDAFIPPCFYDGWNLNSETCLWEMPIPHPDDGNAYQWNNYTHSWDLIEE